MRLRPFSSVSRRWLSPASRGASPSGRSGPRWRSPVVIILRARTPRVSQAMILAVFHSSTVPFIHGSHIVWASAIVFSHLACRQRQWHLRDLQIQLKESQEDFRQATHFRVVHNTQKPGIIQSCSHCFQDSYINLTVYRTGITISFQDPGSKRPKLKF